jgi:hypothetical protein
MKIESKKQFYPLWKGLALGNRIQMFDNIDEFINSKFNGNISIRYREIGSPYKAFYVPADEVLNKVDDFVNHGAIKSLFSFNEATPDHRLILQGEVQYLDKLTLTYNTQQCSMKQAMINPLAATGLRAKMMLEYFMNPNSFDMIRDLFEIYCDSVIEFGIYNVNLGVIPNHNVIIWEVRDY